MYLGARESGWMVYITALIALMLTVIPLPQVLSIIWPNLLVLTVLYWTTMTPRIGGLLIGFLAGLALDVLVGTQLGQHALALSFVTYLAIKAHLLTRAKPLFEQALLVLLALLAYETLLWIIDGFSARDTGNWTRWVHVFSGAALWPVIVGLLGRLHSPR
jgi:rod shape-determining protein MreD